jgi:hypothetical protein
MAHECVGEALERIYQDNSAACGLQLTGRKFCGLDRRRAEHVACLEKSKAYHHHDQKL